MELIGPGKYLITRNGLEQVHSIAVPDMSRARRWIIVDNGVGDAEPTILRVVDAIANGTRQPGVLRYFVGQPERGAEGRLHHQCYAEFSEPMRINSVKLLFGINHLHLEEARGTQQECVDYCTKEDTRAGPTTSWGTPAVAGRKRKTADEQLLDVHSTLRAGASLTEAFELHPTAFIKYQRIRGVLDNDAAQRAPYFRRVRGEAFIGPPGTGKTATAFMEAPELYRPPLRTSEGGSLWFDGYQGQETLLLDDFEGYIPYDMLLNILDVYPLTLQVKGGTCQANWSRVILTSNKEIEEWYPNRTNWDALRRRLNIRRFN